MNLVIWISMVIASHHRVNLRCCPFPTITRNGIVSREENPSLVTNSSWMKLWVLSPSMRITTWWPERKPSNRSVSRAKWLVRELKLIWVWSRSLESGEAGHWSRPSIFITGGFSSSAIKRKTLEAQQWPLWYLSSLESWGWWSWWRR